MDLGQAFSEAKSLPDEALIKELDSPSGMIPGYIVLGELNERRAVRTGSKSGAPTTIASDIRGYAKGGVVQGLNPYNDYVNALKFQKRLDKTPPAGAGMALPSLPGLEAPTGIETLTPLQPGIPKAPQSYARGGLVDLIGTEKYIRQRAPFYGIDPDTAVRVAKSEGLAPNTWQSNYRNKAGIREPSYGPFQLLVGGEGTGFGSGLGNKFMQQTGLDPRNPATVNQQVDFALKQASQGGWSPWYGAAKVGVGRWDGINRGAVPPTTGATQVAAQAAQGQAVQQAAAQQATQATQATQAAQMAQASQAANAATAANAAQAAQAAQAASASPFSGLMGLLMMAGASSPAPAPMGGGAPPKFTPNMDPQVVEDTSQTPNVYRKRRRNG